MIICFLCPRIDRSGAYCFTGVFLSVCLSVYLSVHLSAEKFPCELNNLTFSYNFHTVQVTMLIFDMQVAFDNTQLVSVISRSRLNIKVTFLKKKSSFGGISVSQTHLVYSYIGIVCIWSVYIKTWKYRQVGFWFGQVNLWSSLVHGQADFQNISEPLPRVDLQFLL